MDEIEIFKLYKAQKYKEMNEALSAWEMSEYSYKPCVAKLKIIRDVFGANVVKLINDDKNSVYCKIFNGSPAAVCADLFKYAVKRAETDEDKAAVLKEVGDFMKELMEKLQFYSANPYVRAKDYAVYHKDADIDELKKVLSLPDGDKLDAILVSYFCKFWNTDSLPDDVFYCNWLENSRSITPKLKNEIVALDPSAENYIKIAEELESVKQSYIAVIEREEAAKPVMEQIKKVDTEIDGEKLNLAEQEKTPVKTGLFSGGYNKKRQALIDGTKQKIEQLEKKKAGLEASLKGYYDARNSLKKVNSQYGKLFIKYLDAKKKVISELETLLKEHEALEKTPSDFDLYGILAKQRILKANGGVMNAEYWQQVNGFYASMNAPGGLADYYIKKNSLYSLMGQLDRAREEYKNLKNIFHLK